MLFNFMIMDAKDRILHYAEIKGIKVSELEKNISMSRNYFKNTSKVSVEAVVNFLSVYREVSPEWLLTGEGEMLRSSSSEESPKEEPSTDSRLLSLIESQQRTIERQASTIENLSRK